MWRQAHVHKYTQRSGTEPDDRPDMPFKGLHSEERWRPKRRAEGERGAKILKFVRTRSCKPCGWHHDLGHPFETRTGTDRAEKQRQQTNKRCMLLHSAALRMCAKTPRTQGRTRATNSRDRAAPPTGHRRSSSARPSTRDPWHTWGRIGRCVPLEQGGGTRGCAPKRAPGPPRSRDRPMSPPESGSKSGTSLGWSCVPELAINAEDRTHGANGHFPMRRSPAVWSRAPPKAGPSHVPNNLATR